MKLASMSKNWLASWRRGETVLVYTWNTTEAAQPVAQRQVDTGEQAWWVDSTAFLLLHRANTTSGLHNWLLQLTSPFPAQIYEIPNRKRDDQLITDTALAREIQTPTCSRGNHRSLPPLPKIKKERRPWLMARTWRPLLRHVHHFTFES